MEGRRDRFWHLSDMPGRPDDVRSQGDFVAKVENRTSPKISRRSI